MKFYQKIGFRLFLLVVASVAALATLEIIEERKAEELFFRSTEERLSGQVSTAIGYLKHYDKEVKSGRMTLEDAQKRAADVINDLRIGSDGYFFVFDPELSVIAHGATHSLIGENQAGTKDSQGTLIYEGLQDVALNGGGTFRYHFPKPGGTTPVAKIAYAAHFEAWGWTIGTGTYLDAAEEEIAQNHRAAIVLGGLIAAALATLSYFLTRTVTAPLAKLQTRMASMTEGDLETSVPGVIRRDELGEMARSIDVFRQKLMENEKLEKDAKEAAEAAALAKEREVEAKVAAEREELARQKEAADEKRQREEREEERVRIARDEEAARLEKERLAQELVVGEIGRGLKSLAAGDLTLRLTQPFAESYDQLRVDFNSAIGALAELMGELLAESNALDHASSAAAGSAGNATERSQQNAASLEETAAALHEISTSVTSAAGTARDVSELVTQANGTAGTSRKTVSDAVAAMHKIAESSREIASIISVMENIAFQTNLLALNAGVEAARAGEQGRGFAVVASEVRALAQRSSEAATEVRVLIEQSSKHVDTGVELVDTTGTRLQEIADAVEHISNEMLSITRSTEEQSRTLTSVSSAVTEIDRASQSASASLVEVDTSCATMKAICVNLLSQVSHFQVEQQGIELRKTG